ncbi:MAG: DUF4886 domain-containing protein [Vicingaceae bacterium]|nr:DUF4886 domain-containing protein [Vicingaceae bacterium]
MKKITIIIVALLSLISVNAQIKKVLFIGNSYTYANDLPQLLKDLALSKSDTVYTDQSTPGGHYFAAHVNNTTTLTKINQDQWDYVVLQEQSQIPALPQSITGGDYSPPHATTLDSLIKNNNSCSEVVFYMTWGRQNGDASYCTQHPPVCTYNGMQQELRNTYMQMANTNSSTVSPVGVAWKNMRDSFPSVNLYAGDGSHPNLHGSYLAACVFYSTLYQKSCIGASFVPAGITTIDAFNIQTIATNTVLDSLSLWRINANHPTANFTYSGGGTINFTNTSNNDVYYSWNFGDGNTSTQENPSNTYNANNTYQVQLIVYSTDSCFTDSITQQITITTAGISGINNTIETSIYPNPANSKITIKSNFNYNKGVIINTLGKVVIEFSKEKIIDIHNLDNGVYIIKLFHSETETINLKFVKD